MRLQLWPSRLPPTNRHLQHTNIDFGNEKSRARVTPEMALTPLTSDEHMAMITEELFILYCKYRRDSDSNKWTRHCVKKRECDGAFSRGIHLQICDAGCKQSDRPSA